MLDLSEEIKRNLVEKGANLVGIGDLSELEPELRINMPFGICVAIAINPEVIDGIAEFPTRNYFEEYKKLNDQLDQLVNFGAEYLHNLGYEAYPQTREIVSRHETEYTSLLPHKTIATRAGIGWIGKCALLVTKNYGSAVRISAILTNAPLNADRPINESSCGKCLNCTRACPAEAVKGNNWSLHTEREEIFDPVKCRKTARKIAWESIKEEITLCGKCIYVCPYTQKYIKKCLHKEDNEQ